jgi:hypothetical protein
MIDMSMDEMALSNNNQSIKAGRGNKAISHKAFNETGRNFSKMDKTTAASINNQTNFPSSVRNGGPKSLH